MSIDCGPGLLATDIAQPAKTLAVDIGGPIDVNVLNVDEIATAICEALEPKFDLIVETIINNAARFDGEFLPTQFCTLEGEPVYVCKVVDPVTGAVSFEYHVVPDGGGVSVPYTGPREVCQEELSGQTFAEACFDFCNPGLVCVDKSGAVLSWLYTTPTGDVESGVGAPAGFFQLGACAYVTETKRVWDMSGDGCPTIAADEVTVRLCGPEMLLQTAAGWVPIEDVYPSPQYAVLEECDDWSECQVCPVEAADYYDAHTLSRIEIVPCPEWDCETKTWSDVVTVQIGDTSIELTGGERPYVYPPDGVDCGCGLIPKEITITGPAEVRAWTCEEVEVCP